jgi:hypothetical protein
MYVGQVNPSQGCAFCNQNKSEIYCYHVHEGAHVGQFFYTCRDCSIKYLDINPDKLKMGEEIELEVLSGRKG